MTPGRRPHHVGAALLVVLGVLAVTTTASVTLCTAIAERTLQRRADDATERADDLLRTAEAPIRHWLHHVASSVVLPPDATAPEVPILHDRWTVPTADGSWRHELRITAWDQCGMAPIGLVGRDAGIDGWLPPDVRGMLRESAPAPVRGPRLEQLTTEVASTGRVRLFPTPHPGEPARFGDDRLDAEPATREPTRRRPDRSRPAIAAVVAMQNDAPGRININTAPAALLDRIFRRAGRSGLEHVLEARRQGRWSSLGAVHAAPDTAGNASTLVASSHVWSVRIDIRVGPVCRSWWAVYRRSGRQSWECVQRRAIRI